VARAGIPTCFVVDSVTFFVSAFITYLIPGKYDPVENNNADKKIYANLFRQVWGMTADGAEYIRSSSFGSIIFLKASAALLYGASNVLNVSLSEQLDDDPTTTGFMMTTTGVVDDDDNDDISNADALAALGDGSSERLGLLYGVVGLGSILGPVLHDVLIGHRAGPPTLQMACIASLLIITTAYLGMGLFAKHQFAYLIFFSAIRSMGAAALWIDSSVMLQVRVCVCVSALSFSMVQVSFVCLVLTTTRRLTNTHTYVYHFSMSPTKQRFTAPDMLGRIMAADNALALLAESGSAFLGGYLLDVDTFTPESISLLIAALGFVLTMGWTGYHVTGHGVARIKQHPNRADDNNTYKNDDNDDEQIILMHSFNGGGAGAADATAAVPTHRQRTSRGLLTIPPSNSPQSSLLPTISSSSSSQQQQQQQQQQAPSNNNKVAYQVSR
jgi:hypothetical protein